MTTFLGNLLENISEWLDSIDTSNNADTTKQEEPEQLSIEYKMPKENVILVMKNMIEHKNTSLFPAIPDDLRDVLLNDFAHIDLDALSKDQRQYLYDQWDKAIEQERAALIDKFNFESDDGTVLTPVSEGYRDAMYKKLSENWDLGSYEFTDEEQELINDAADAMTERAKTAYIAQSVRDDVRPETDMQMSAEQQAHFESVRADMMREGQGVPTDRNPSR